MSNAYVNLLKILPKKRKFIGEVTAINSSLRLSTITLLGGGVVTAKGIDVSVGQLCLIEDGTIIEQLPALTAHAITIY